MVAAPSPFKIEFAKRAERELKQLDRSVQTRVNAALNLLSKDPFHPGTKQLKHDPTARRARVGDYRIVYEVHNDRIVILVLRIAHRREVYRSL